MKIKQLNHVALHVNDLAASVQFYNHVLNLPEMPRPGFDFAGAWMLIAPATSSAPAQELHLIARPPETDMPPRERHFAMLVDDISAAEQHLREKQWPFTGPHHRPDGARQIFLKDPDGNVVELCELNGNG